MSERLNELSSSVLASLQSGRKVADVTDALRALYQYLAKHQVPLPSVTFKYLLNEIQNKDNAKFKDTKVCQLAILVLFQANRPVSERQLLQGYTRVGSILRSGIWITRECLQSLIFDLDSRLLLSQPYLWAAILHHVMLYTNRLLTVNELYRINLHLYTFLRTNPSTVKRSRFSRGTRYFAPNQAPLTTPLTVLCSASIPTSPLLLVHSVTFSYLRKWLLFIPRDPMEVYELNQTSDAADLISEYCDDVSRSGAGGTTITRASATSRMSLQSAYNDNRFFELGTTYTGRSTAVARSQLTVRLTCSTGSAIQDAALAHVSLLLEHCTVSSKQLVALAAYLECIKILEVIYSTTQSVEVQSEILAAIALITENVKLTKTKYILLPAALRVSMKYSPEFQLAPERNEDLLFLYTTLISASYPTAMTMYEVVMFTLRFSGRLQRLLHSVIPNFFKIIAYRPTTFAREVSGMLPYFYDVSVKRELLLTILFLPVLTAVQLDEPKTDTRVEWVLRVKSNSITFPDLRKLYPSLNLDHPKVLACSQLSNVLLKRLFTIVRDSNDSIFWDCFTALQRIPSTEVFQDSIVKTVTKYLRQELERRSVVAANLDQIKEFLRKVDQVPDHEMAGLLVSVLIPTFSKLKNNGDLCSSVEQQLYIVSARGHITLLSSLTVLLVTLSSQDSTRTEPTLRCLENIRNKVTDSEDTKVQIFLTLLDSLTSLLEIGAGSVVEIHSTSSSPIDSQSTNMLTVLRVVDQILAYR